MNLVIKIALGVILAVVIMGISAALIEFYAIQEMQESLVRQQKQKQARIKQQHEAKLRDHKIQRLLAIKENKKKAETQRIVREKQQAWYVWYNKREPKGCDNWQSDRHMVECINKKMDLKSEFNKMWGLQRNISKNKVIK
mgnify:CR=1 FL=1